MTPEEERDFYARPENQKPQGPPVRRRPRLTEVVPVRFPPQTVDDVRRLAGADDRSVSSWIRRAVDKELEHARARVGSDELGDDAEKARAMAHDGPKRRRKRR